MKKLLLLTIFLGLSSGVFAHEFNLYSSWSSNLFGNNVYQNNESSITLFASGQNGVRAEKNKWPAFLLNMFVGMGIGSFVQGDTVGGLVGLLGELGGMTLVIIGIIPEENQVYQVYQGYGYYTTEYSFPNQTLAYVGLAIVSATRIFELIKPFTYANKFDISFMPGIDNKGKPALTASAVFKF